MTRAAFGGRYRHFACVVAALVTIMLGLAARSAAAAEAPRWVLTAVPTPTNVMANTPRNEVQEVTVAATTGSFTLEILPASNGASSFRSTVPISYDASPAEVREAIGEVAGMAESEVSVATGSGGPGTYAITFEGKEEGEAAIELMRADSSGLDGGTAEVREVARGAAPPELIVTATNVGGASTTTGVTLADTLPPWLEATSVSGFAMYQSAVVANGKGGSAMSCAPLTPPAHSVTCTYATHPIDPGDQLVMTLRLAAGAAEAGAVNLAEVSGGGPAPMKVETALEAGAKPAGYGFAPGSVFAAVSTDQAGAHPNVTTAFELTSSETDQISSDPKDVRFDLPPGLVGSTVGMPRCSMQRVITAVKGVNVCPDDTMVGMATVALAGKNHHPERDDFIAPIYNITPSPGEPAAFGFDAILLPVRLDTTVLSDGNYGVRVTAPNLPETESAIASNITIWGVPSEYSGAGKNGELLALKPSTFGGADAGQSPVPLLTNPQQCDESLVATAATDPWSEPGAFRSQAAPVGALTSCLTVPFSSSFTFLPDTLEAGAPAGYTFDLNVPQQNTAGTLATSSVKDVSLKLPEGVVVNPSAAWGLKACSNAQFYGSDHPSQEPASLAECPREAQVGEVEVETPDLEKPLKGQVFLGSPECDPCTPSDAEEGRMVRLFVQLVGEGEAGIIVKLEGHADVNQQTGQITTVFEETPQVPFNKMRFVLEGGPRAVLANPRKCGTVKAAGDLRPWSSLLAEGEAGLVSDSMPTYEFEINENCFGSRFSPSFKAGMPNIQAGARGEFTLAFGREDDDEFLGGVSVRMPEGLMGSLVGIPLCGEAEANAGTCAAESQIGTVEVLTGPGANPFLVSGGHVYLTEGYGGSQFGLSIVVPAVAGPYTLGGVEGQGNPADSGTVVVRSQIFVDPHTAQLTVTSGRLPSMLDGIPLQLKAVNVRIDRPGFMFNPTSCERKQIAGTLTAVEGLSANVSSSFQVTNCAALGFKPGFSAMTKARHTRKDGAYLRVSVSSGEGQANIARAKVELPKALPSELKTLQKACTEAQFDANPAGCPPESDVGSVVVHTPVLPVPLTGPAYFVSRGAQWPELIMVLQGYGVTVDLAGETHISKGVTSTTLGSVPDVPFTSFTLTLPQSPHSALAGNGNLCKKQLIMPVKLTGQNGATLDKNTKVKVTGCASSRKKHKGKAKKHKGKGAKRKARKHEKAQKGKR